MLDTAFHDCPARSAQSGDGQNRRQFLRAGSLGLAGLSLPGLLHARGESTNEKTRARSVILVFLGGGFSHIDTFDPKPDAPDTVRGKYRPVHTAVPGLVIGEKLPLLACVMDRVALVRSASHSSDHHEIATNWVLSGRRGSAFGDFPALGAVVAHESVNAGRVPPYVAVPRNPSFTWELGKSAFLGKRFESFNAGDPSKPNYRVQSEISSETQRAFAIDREPSTIHDRYGRGAVGQSMLLARRLVENGVRFVTVSCGGWDHHAGIYNALDRKLPVFDRTLSALIEDMDARDTCAETLLVVMSEFGRSPRLNQDRGRDHWCHAGSILLAGAGVKRGVVLGRTDSQGAFPIDRPVSPADIAQTILASLGIVPQKRLSMADGRPMRILDSGETIRELLV